MPWQSTSVALDCDCLAHRFGNVADNGVGERRYPTDMTDAEWRSYGRCCRGWMHGRGGQPEAY
ncbi:hypothetical protein [Streptomyces sp. MC1]|uniref:hypothetical protein n=1 Tax=Streptomyces sp. MC1 TaxID=295105 RepID=UPI001E4AD588|nr:hypothetical protein [Streptomyces sp. MC1]